MQIQGTNYIQSMFRFRSRTIFNLYSDSGHELYSIYIQITIQITICGRLYADSGHELYSIYVQIQVTNYIQSIFRFRSRLRFDLHSDRDLFSYIFPVSCTRDVPTTCSVREVLSADFACHACRSSGLFSS